MQPNKIRAVNFPLLPVKTTEGQKKQSKLPSILKYSFMIITSIVVILFLTDNDSDFFQLTLLFWILLVYVVSFKYFRNNNTDTEEVIYLKNKNRLRFDVDYVMTKINETSAYYELSKMSEIKIFYTCFARKSFGDNIFSGIGLNNYIVFSYEGKKHKYQFYLDNRTWVILLDKMLYKWAWDGHEIDIFYKGKKVYKLPVDY